jgi:hypothetical protein
MWDRVVASVGGSTTWDKEDQNFGERRQGQSESEISGSIGKMEKGDIIAVPPSKGQHPRRPIYESSVI